MRVRLSSHNRTGFSTLTAIVLFAMVLSIWGCTAKRQSSLTGQQAFFLDNKADETTPRKETEDGIFVADDGLYIKYQNRSFITALDELFYKKRLNYTVLTDISRYRLKFFDKDFKGSAEELQKNWNSIKQRKYDGVIDFLSSSIENINSIYHQNDDIKLGYRIVGDGIEFCRKERDKEGPSFDSCIDDQEYKNTYKKIFLFSLTTQDASEKLGLLYFGKKVFPPAMQQGGFMPPPQMDYGIQDGTSKVYEDIITLPAQNALIVKAGKGVLEQIGQVIYSIDAEFPQVLVETKVFEYDDSIARKIGTAIEYSRTTGKNQFDFNALFGDEIPRDQSGNLTIPSFLYNLADPENRYKFLTAIAFTDRDGMVRIIAEPRLVLKPGEEASIKLNTEKYVIVRGVNTADLRTVGTGITFTLTPTILSEKKIFLKLSLEQSEFIPGAEGDIILSSNKNTIDTSVIVGDGEWISIGGIETKKQSKFSTGLPYLKDIPILGYLFGTRAVDAHNSRIEFMIRPVIKNIKGENRRVLDEINRKNEDVNKELLKNY